MIKENSMKISKKYQCMHCNTIVEEDGKCNCMKIVLVENQLVSQATVGIDYNDLTPKLLNE
jgi:hypothetical protein